MNDPKSIANNVSRWTGLGVKLPKELSDAIGVFESLTYTEVGYQPVFDIAEVTATNAEEKIREYAEKLVLTDVPGGGWSVLDKAKNHAVEVAARRVNQLARVAVAGIIEQLTPEFNQHAAAYVAAVRSLPADHDVNAGQKSTTSLSERLVAAGPEAVTSYQDAQQESLYLNKIHGWVFEAGLLTGVAQIGAEVALRILRPTTALQLIELDRASHKQSDPSLIALNPIWVAAALKEVEFGINTLQEAMDIRSRLESAAAGSVQFA